MPSDRQQEDSPLAVGFFRKYHEFTAMFFALPMHLAYNPAESGFNQDRGTPGISRDDSCAERRSRRAKWIPVLPSSGEFDTVDARPNGKRSGCVRHEILDEPSDGSGLGTTIVGQTPRSQVPSWGRAKP